MTSKPFDLVVYGATGFTGELVTSYLLTNDETALTGSAKRKWAIAGRSASKLAQVKDRLKQKHPEVAPQIIDQLPVVIADAHDAQAIGEMVQSTKVVLSVTGPYAIHGSILVEQCVENGVHYCDLTGEVIWINQMIKKHEARAKETGARIVHCCGFESIPSEVSAFSVADHMRKKQNKEVGEIATFLTRLKGGVSGGTLASVLNMFESNSVKEFKRSAEPFYLLDESAQQHKQQLQLYKPNSLRLTLKWEPDLNKWSSWFIGSAGNATVVHRTNHLLNDYYGSKLVYRERFAIGNFFSQLFATMGLIFFSACLNFRFSRFVISKLVPSPGTGPSEYMQRTGYFEMKSFGYDINHKLAVKATVSGAGDPGYFLTARMISECALALANDETFDGKAVKGGFWTPISAFGSSIVNRLTSKRLFNVQVEETS